MSKPPFKAWKTWSIDVNYKDVDGRRHVGYIGRYFFQLSQIPGHLEGCVISMFNTRREAREALKKVKNAYPDARVVRMHIDARPDDRAGETR